LTATFRYFVGFPLSRRLLRLGDLIKHHLGGHFIAVFDCQLAK
jgi:hypothetical protein